MKKYILIILSLNLTLITYSQTENKKINSIGISIPIIWNKSSAAYYQLGTRKESEGNGISFGIDLNYTKTIFKPLFGVIGIGYFKQTFGIKRPFNFISPNATRPLIQTESYLYDNIHFNLGLGYQTKLSKSLYLNGTVVYNYYNSYKQQYNQTYFPNYSQISHNRITLGNTINFNIGINKSISKKIAIGLSLLLPVYTKWNNDETFYKYDYADDTQVVGKNKFSIGTTISCNYNF